MILILLSNIALLVCVCFVTTWTCIIFAAFRLFHLVWNLMTMLLWHIFALLFRVVAAYFPGGRNTTRLQEHLISIVAYSFWNRPAMLGIDSEYSRNLLVLNIFLKRT